MSDEKDAMNKGIQRLPAFVSIGHGGWHTLNYKKNQGWYAEHLAKGQRPRAMIIGCCDSRVDVSAIMGAEPGTLFILRNVANLVPPYCKDHAHHGTSAAIEYAICELKISTIIVMGHANCGGIESYYKSCKNNADNVQSDSAFIGNWISMLEPAYKRIGDTQESEEAGLKALEQEAIKVSLENLATFPFIQKAIEEDRLGLHGAWFDIGSGTLYEYSPENNSFMSLLE